VKTDARPWPLGSGAGLGALLPDKSGPVRARSVFVLEDHAQLAKDLDLPAAWDEFLCPLFEPGWQ
jgi:hypothetical protein